MLRGACVAEADVARRLTAACSQVPNVHLSELQLIGITALGLAAKVEVRQRCVRQHVRVLAAAADGVLQEVYPPDAASFAASTDGTCSRNSIASMEHCLLTVRPSIARCPRSSPLTRACVAEGAVAHGPHHGGGVAGVVHAGAGVGAAAAGAVCEQVRAQCSGLPFAPCAHAHALPMLAQ